MKTDARVRYTKKVLRDALLSCMAQKQVKDITITEICKAAEINRATFYKHYKGVEEVLDELGQEQISQFRSMLDKNQNSLKPLIKDMLNSIDVAKELYQVRDGGTVSGRFKEGVVSTLNDYLLHAWKNTHPKMDEREAALLFEGLLAGALQIALKADGKKERKLVETTILNMFQKYTEVDV